MASTDRRARAAAAMQVVHARMVLGCRISGRLLTHHGCSVTHGVVCLATGLWRAEYCRACTRQQKEDAVVVTPSHAPARSLFFACIF
jgi:hypothetical protein